MSGDLETVDDLSRVLVHRVVPLAFDVVPVAGTASSSSCTGFDVLRPKWRSGDCLDPFAAFELRAIVAVENHSAGMGGEELLKPLNDLRRLVELPTNKPGVHVGTFSGSATGAGVDSPLATSPSRVEMNP